MIFYGQPEILPKIEIFWRRGLPAAHQRDAVGTVIFRFAQHVRQHATQGKNWQRVADKLLFNFCPAKSFGFGVGWRWQNGAQQCVVEVEMARAGDFVGAVAGGAYPSEVRALRAVGEAD